MYCVLFGESVYLVFEWMEPFALQFGYLGVFAISFIGLVWDRLASTALGMNHILVKRNKNSSIQPFHLPIPISPNAIKEKLTIIVTKGRTISI